jgi:hypothetical protein
VELIKHLSDKILISFLKSTSGFAKELTKQGHEEQNSWREQRLRNLKGLSIRSKQRYAEKANPVQVS